MNLLEYLSDAGISQAHFGELLGVTQGMVNHWCNNLVPSPERCVAIEKATNGKVTRKNMRPDDWESIWPELANRKAA